MTLYEKLNHLIKLIDKDAAIENEMVKNGLDYHAHLKNVIQHRGWIIGKLREMVATEAYK